MDTTEIECPGCGGTMKWPEAGQPLILVCDDCGERMELDIDLDIDFDFDLDVSPAAEAPAPAAAVPPPAAAAEPELDEDDEQDSVAESVPEPLLAIKIAAPSAVPKASKATPAVRVVQESTVRRPVLRDDDDDYEEAPQLKPDMGRPKKKKKKMRLDAGDSQRMQSARPSMQNEQAVQQGKIKNAILLTATGLVLLLLLGLAPIWLYQNKYVDCGNYTQQRLITAPYTNPDDRSIARGLAYRQHAAASWGEAPNVGAGISQVLMFLTTDRDTYYAQVKASVDAEVAMMRGTIPETSEPFVGSWVQIYYPGIPYGQYRVIELMGSDVMSTQTRFPGVTTPVPGPSGTWSMARGQLIFSLPGDKKSHDIITYNGSYLVLREGHNAVSIWMRDR